MSSSPPINLFLLDNAETISIVDTTNIPARVDTLAGSFSNLKGYGVTPYGTTEYGLGTDYTGDIDTDFSFTKVDRDSRVMPDPILDFPLQSDLTFKKGVGTASFLRNTLATYRGPDGYIRNCPHNFLDWSTDLTQWTLIGTTVSPEAGGFRITDFRDDLVAEIKATTDNVLKDGKTYTFTFLLMKNTHEETTVGFRYSFSLGTTSLTSTSSINTSTGQFVTNGTYDNFSVEDYDDTWWKVTLTVTNNNSGNTRILFRIFPTFRVNINASTGTGILVGSCVIKDPQMEQNISASEYVPTSGAPVYGPRFEKITDTITSNPNLITSPEDFLDSTWTTNGSANILIKNNFGVAPDGTKTTSVIEDVNTGNWGLVFYNLTINSNLTYTFSCYLKKDNISKNTRFIGIRLHFKGGAINEVLTLNVDTNSGNIAPFNSPSKYSIESINKDWWRIQISAKSQAGDHTSVRAYLYPAIGGNPSNWLWDSGTLGSIEVWGAKLEESHVASEYIPISKVKRNLLEYSEEFERTEWEKDAQLTVTGNNAKDPNSNFTADNLVGTGNLKQSVITDPIGKTYTYSIYLRSDTPTVMTGKITCLESLESGTVNFNVTNNWTRFSITRTFSLAGSTLQSILANTNPYDIEAWGAQLEESSVMTGYQKVTDGTEFTRSRNAWLHEGNSTNLLIHSEDLGNAIWGNTNITVNTNTLLSLNNTLTGAKVIASAVSSDNHGFSRSTITNVTGQHTFSVFLKDEGIRYGYLWLNGPPNAQIFFDLKLGILGNNAGTNFYDASIKKYNNNWYRLSCTIDSTTTFPINVRVMLSDGFNKVAAWTGDGVNGIGLWGPQFESLPFPTSYIPTDSTTVTRDREELSVDAGNIDTFDKPFTIIAKSRKYALGTPGFDTGLMGISGEVHRFLSISGGISLRNGTGTLTAASAYGNEFNRDRNIAWSSVHPTQKVYLDGTKIFEGDSPTSPTGLATGINIGSREIHIYHYWGHISNFKIYNVELTNEQIIEAHKET